MRRSRAASRSGSVERSFPAPAPRSPRSCSMFPVLRYRIPRGWSGARDPAERSGARAVPRPPRHRLRRPRSHRGAGGSPVRRGEGPGEISESNGIFLSGDSLLWINDHGKGAIIGVDIYRGYMARRGSGRSFYERPFEASDIVVVNPTGGFWQANTASYRLTRTDAGGDTIVVIEAALPVQTVTAADRAEYVQKLVDRDPGRRPRCPVRREGPSAMNPAQSPPASRG